MAALTATLLLFLFLLFTVPRQVKWEAGLTKLSI